MSVNNYGNANVAGLLPVYGGNISANYMTGTLLTPVQPYISVIGTIEGDFSTTGNVIGEGNLHVVSDISTTDGNLNINNGYITATGNIVTAGNVVGGINVVAINEFIGNGMVITGNIEVTGIKTDNYYYANSVPINFANIGNSNYSNSNVAAYLPTYFGNAGFNNVDVLGNLSVAGNIVFIDTETITTNDLNIQLANNQSTGAAAAGFEKGINRETEPVLQLKPID